MDTEGLWILILEILKLLMDKDFLILIIQHEFNPHVYFSLPLKEVIIPKYTE